MGYAVQNSETGEVDFIYSDASTFQHPEIDEETGEPLNGKLKVRYVKHKSFQIPKKYLRGTMCEEFEKRMTGQYQDSPEPIQVVQIKPMAEQEAHESKPKKQQYQRDDYIKMDCVKNDIILGYNKANYRLFLIPTLFFFNIYWAMVCGIIETVLHFWAHKKNGLNMNKEIYYRSPLHILTSQFCSICRSEREMDIKIFDMLNKQMREARVSKTLKDVTKALS